MKREINGYELEGRYVLYISEVNKAKKHWLFPLLMKLKKFRSDHEFMVSELESRLVQLNKDRMDGRIQKRAYAIWKNMIENALK